MNLETEDFLQMEEESIAERSTTAGGVSSSTGEEAPDEMLRGHTSVAPSRRIRPDEDAIRTVRTRRVKSTNLDHVVVAPRGTRTVSVPVPPSPFNTGSPTGSGRWMRVAGNLLLGVVAVIWVLLLIGTIDNPDDLGETIGGGAVMTLVPLLFGLVLRRAGKRRGIAA